MRYFTDSINFLSGHDLHHSQQKSDETRLFSLSGYSITSANGQRQEIFRQDKLLTVKVISKQNNLTSAVSEPVWVDHHIIQICLL